MSRFKGKEKPSWIRTREFSIDLIERDKIQRRLSTQKKANGPINIHKGFVELKKDETIHMSAGCIVPLITGGSLKDYEKKMDEYWDRVLPKSRSRKLTKHELKVLHSSFPDDRC